jgi:hypothetical protein
MTLPAQLRAIADRLDAADAARRAAINDLAELAGGAWVALDELGDAIEASVLATDESDGGAGSVEDPAPPAAPVAIVHVPPESAALYAPPSLERFPDAPSTAYMSEDDLMVVGEQAWSEAEWNGPAGHQWRLQHRSQAERTGKTGGPTCPECGKLAASEHGLKVHRARAHGVKGTKHDRPGPAAFNKEQRGHRPVIVDGDPTEPNGHDFKAEDAARVKPVGIEWFLCNACPARYTSRLRLDEHVARTHVDREPRRMPVGRAHRSEVDAALHPGLRGGV